MKHFIDNSFTIIGGPCSLESSEQIDAHFNEVGPSNYLRAGIYKLRTQPDSFQGLRGDAIDLIKTLKKKHQFQLVSEVVSEHSFHILKDTVDIFQIGTRNMYNYELLKTISNESNKPIILKRAFSATIEEWIKAAKYINNSSKRVILCERGIRSFETAYRNTLDLNAVSYIKHKHPEYKVIVDPSHGTGEAFMVEDLALAALSVGADGLLLEAHYKPSESISDANQAISLEKYNNIVIKIKKIASYFNKKVVT